MKHTLKDKALIMFSGGLGSTATFFKIVDKYTVINIHHISIQTDSDDGKAELLSVRSMIEVLINYFPSKEMYYSDSYVSFPLKGDISTKYIINAIGLNCSESLEIPPSSIYLGNYGKCSHTPTRFKTPLKDYGIGEVFKIVENYEKAYANTWSCSMPLKTDKGYVRCGECLSCTVIKYSGLCKFLPYIIKTGG